LRGGSRVDAVDAQLVITPAVGDGFIDLSGKAGQKARCRPAARADAAAGEARTLRRLGLTQLFAAPFGFNFLLLIDLRNLLPALGLELGSLLFRGGLLLDRGQARADGAGQGHGGELCHGKGLLE